MGKLKSSGEICSADILFRTISHLRRVIGDSKSETLTTIFQLQ